MGSSDRILNAAHALGLMAGLLLGLTSLARPAAAEGNPAVAYIEGGDVWVKTLPDGHDQRLTRDGRNQQPRWSHDGRWLAFRKTLRDSQQLWVVVDEEGLSPAQLASDPSFLQFAWSPTDDRLAYVAGGGLDVAEAGRSEVRQIVAPPADGDQAMGVKSLAWNPEGTRLAYVQYSRLQPDAPGQRQAPYAALLTIPIAGGVPTEVLNQGRPSNDGLVLAGWAAHRILFWPDPGFSASALADGVALEAVSDSAASSSSSEAETLVSKMLIHPDFLAPALDDHKLAVVAGGLRSTWFGKTVDALDLRDGSLVTLSDPNASAFSPAWSPDSSQVAYVQAPAIETWGIGGQAASGLRRIWTASADGLSRRQLTTDDGYQDGQPRWSADGRQIVFTRATVLGGHTSLWLMADDGQDPRQVVADMTLGPQPPGASPPLGFYGWVNWGLYFDWWPGLPGPPPSLASTAAPTYRPLAIAAVGTLGLACLIGMSLLLRRLRRSELP